MSGRIEATVTGAEAIAWNGEAWTGPAALNDLARDLIGREFDPATPMALLRDGRVSLSGTIHSFARVTWQGAEADPAFGPWRPHPRGNYPRALMWWHEKTAEADREARRERLEAKKALATPRTSLSGKATEPAA